MGGGSSELRFQTSEERAINKSQSIALAKKIVVWLDEHTDLRDTLINAEKHSRDTETQYGFLSNERLIADGPVHKIHIQIGDTCPLRESVSADIWFPAMTRTVYFYLDGTYDLPHERPEKRGL